MDGIFYVVEVDLPAEALAEFIPWYGGVHAPHLFQAGFTACTSYRAVSGGFPVVDIYLGRDWSLFESEAFQRYRPIAKNDPHRPAALGRVHNLRTVYRHAVCLEGGAAADATWLDTDWISIWRFPADEAGDAERAVTWLRTEGSERLSGLGARKLRLIERTADAPTGTSHRPPLALVVEWPRRPPDAAEAVLPDWIRAKRTDENFFTGLRLFPWAEEATNHRVALDLIRNGR